MTIAKSNLIKLSIISFLIWLIFLILGYTINDKEILSNILFGIGAILLSPFIYFFFKSKSFKKNNISKYDIENYLQLKEIQELEKQKNLLDKKVSNLKCLYWLGFSCIFAFLFIGLASILAFL